MLAELGCLFTDRKKIARDQFRYLETGFTHFGPRGGLLQSVTVTCAFVLDNLWQAAFLGGSLSANARARRYEIERDI